MHDKDQTKQVLDILSKHNTNRYTHMYIFNWNQFGYILFNCVVTYEKVIRRHHVYMYHITLAYTIYTR